MTVPALEGPRPDTGGAVLDALSFIDAISDAERQAAEALIDDEMKRSTRRPADYLRELGPVPALVFEVRRNERARG